MSLTIFTFFIVGIILIHLLYQIFLFFGLRRIPLISRSDLSLGVSVVIAARNEYHNLKRLVPALLNQKYPDFEIIIVNDRSEDESFHYLREIDNNPKIKVVTVKHLPEHVNSKKYALTLGIKAASYDTLLLTDADCLPASREWIRSMVTGYNDQKEIVLGFSPYEKKKGILNALIRFESHLNGILYLSSASNGRPYMGVGRNLSYKKTLFLNNKGFNGFQEVTGGDDDLFVNKSSTSKNTGISLSRQSITLSIPKETWSGFLSQKIRHMSVGKYYRKGDKIFLGLFFLSHILSWILVSVALIGSILPFVSGTLFALSQLMFILNFRILNLKSGSTFSLWTVPFVDVVYGFFYIFVGMRTIFTKKVEWTT